MRWVGHAASIVEMRNTHKILVRKPRGKRPLRRPRHKQEDNIRIDLQEVGWEVVEWIHLTQNKDQWRALVNSVMKLQVTGYFMS
jgi:ribosome biogenesis protein Nip4